MTPIRKEFLDKISSQDFSPTMAKRLTEELIETLTLKLNKYCKQPKASQKTIEDGQKIIDKLWAVYHCCIPLTNQDVWNVVEANIESMKEIDPELNCLHIVIQIGRKNDKPGYLNLTI